MSQMKKIKRTTLGIGIVIVILIALFAIFRSLQNSPQVALKSDTSNVPCVTPKDTAPIQLSHMSLGMTKEFYNDYNKLFTEKWKCQTGQTVTINQNFNVSGVIMRDMLKGKLSPDILTLANPAEMDKVAQGTGTVSTAWRDAFPYESSPFYSAVVFLVRKNNPKQIKDWEDLVKPGIVLAASDPKLCGGGRWVYTAALGFAMRSSDALSDQSKSYMTKFYNNFPVLYDNQALAGDAFYAENSNVDVLLTYEKEALLGKGLRDDYEIVNPSRTVQLDFPVAIVNKFADRDGVTDIAKAYIKGLYDPDAQSLAATYFLRPKTPASQDLLKRFPNLSLFTRKDVFGSDPSIENAHLGDGGLFDSLKKQ